MAAEAERRSLHPWSRGSLEWRPPAFLMWTRLRYLGQAGEVGHTPIVGADRHVDAEDAGGGVGVAAVDGDGWGRTGNHAGAGGGAIPPVDGGRVIGGRNTGFAVGERADKH